MAAQPQFAVRLAFGSFEVHTEAGELRKRGIRVRLSGQPFQILLVLLAHPGEVVTREQLREEVWVAGTFVDFEHGLNAAMNKLRGALSDSPENPRYIETLLGRGYRFIGTLERDLVQDAEGNYQYAGFGVPGLALNVAGTGPLVSRNLVPARLRVPA